MSDAAPKSSARAGKKAKPRTATVADSPGACLLLDGQPAVGLFVLCATTVPKPQDDSPNSTVLQQAAANAPVPQFTLFFVDGKGYLINVTEGQNPWHDIGKQLDELDGLRLKAKKKKTVGPVFAETACSKPHMVKLTEGIAYQFCLVGHPNPEVAWAMQKYLNGGKPDPRFKFPKKETLVFEAKVTTDEHPGGKSAHIDLPTMAAKYWPAGPTQYGGWILYRDMPYGHLDAVTQAVAQLAVDLGDLRYPTGEFGSIPYPSKLEPPPADEADDDDDDDDDESVKKSAKKVAKKAPKKAPKGMYHSGFFGTTLMAVVHAFQKDATAGRAFEIFSPMRGQSNDWAFLLGKTAKTTPIAGMEEDLGVGVVTPAVADAIAKWKTDGLRKDGEILIRSTVDRACWGRPDLVMSLARWNVMAKALGCVYGIKLLCTFRELTVPAGVGRVECSNHKLGLSVDLLSEHFRYTKATWPVRYEANWYLLNQGDVKTTGDAVRAAQKKYNAVPKKSQEAKDAALESLENAKRAADDTVKSAYDSPDAAKSIFQLFWRIYGHSSLAAFVAPAKPKDAATAAAAASLPGVALAASVADKIVEPVPAAGEDLQKALAEAEMLGKNEDGSWEVVKRLEKTLTASFPSTTDKDAAGAIQAIIKEQTEAAQTLAAKLYDMAGKEGKKGEEGLVSAMFRWTICPFDYDPFEADGGTSLPPQTVATDKKAAEAAVLFKDTPINSWLNLTRLGYECGMRRIGAQRAVSTGTFKNPTLDPEFKPAPKKAPKEEVFDLLAEAKSKAARKREKVGDRFCMLAQSLQDMVKAPEAGKMKIVRQDGQEEEVAPSDFDAGFIETWGTLMKAKDVNLDYRAAALVLALTASQEAFDERRGKLSDFEDKPFWLVDVGERLGLAADKGKVKTLGEWLGQMTKLAERLLEQKDKKTVASMLKTTAEWSMFLCPAIRPGAAEGQQPIAMTFPPSGQAAPLEWWHHDSAAMSGSWAAMAELIGYAGSVVEAADTPPATVTKGMCQRGLGFDSKRMDRDRTPTGGPPENQSAIPKGG